MNQREKIQKLLKERPELALRKNRYLLASILTDIDPHKCKQIASVLDEYRHQTKVDEVGKRMEREWHYSDFLRVVENNQIAIKF